MARKFLPESYERLHSRERREIQDPSKLIDLLGLFPGARVADLGCGSGFFTLEVAGRLGEGEVWAVDISQEMLGHLKRNLEREGVGNIRPLLSEESRIPLADAYLDRALLVVVLHEAEERPAFLREVRRVVKPGGVLVLADWHKAPSPMGPPLEDRVTEEEAVSLLEGAGFKDIESHHLYRYQYVLTGRA